MRFSLKNTIATIVVLSLFAGCLAGCGAATNTASIDANETVSGFYVDQDSGKIIDAETGKETEDTTLAVDSKTGNIVDTQTGETVQTKTETETVAQKVEKIAEAKTVTVPENHTHSYTSETIAPTCASKGYTKLSCKCGDIKKENYTNALGHSFGDYITELNATCAKEGKQVRTCTRCGKREEKVVSKTSHTFGNWVTTKQPTTASKGQKQRTCSVCGYAETQDIAKLPAQQHTMTYAETELLRLINESRAEAGLNALAFNYTDYDCAEIRAKELAKCYMHTRPDGRSYVTVFGDKGVGGNYNCFGENLYGTAPWFDDSVIRDFHVQYAHTALMDSPGHRANILSSNFTSVALCFYYDKNRGELYLEELFFG